MKVPSLVRAFVLAAAFSRCHAGIEWQDFTCAGKSLDGATPDQMWDNARAMVARAVERLNVAKGAKSINPLSEETCAANNAKWLWGTKPSLRHTIGDEDKAVLDDAIARYDQVANLLATNAGYFFCDDNAWQWMESPGFMTGAWHFIPPGGTNAQLIFLKNAGQMPPPTAICTVDSTGVMLGLTGRGVIPQYNAQGDLVNSIHVNIVIFCLGNHARVNRKGVLNSNYAAASRSSADAYASGAGTIIHEMFHVIDLEDIEQPSLFPGVAYNYDRSALFAQTDPSLALHNPDNYRVFAEMSMADPTTRWGAPQPVRRS